MCESDLLLLFAVSPNTGLVTPQDLRATMVPLLQHTRLCTIAPAELCKDVIPSRILSLDEIEHLCNAIGLKEQSSNLSSICDETKKRGQSKLLAINNKYNGSESNIKMMIQTKAAKVKISSLRFKSHNVPQTPCKLPQNLSYDCKATVKIYKLTSQNDYSKEPLREVEFNQQILCGKSSEIFINVDLEANSKYALEAHFDYPHPIISYNYQQKMINSNEISISLLPTRDSCGYIISSGSALLHTFFSNWSYKVYE